ncbi:lytic transglycosylase domain-containing protein [Oceanospirillum beijerinckii]|uniref:lytic transglycosylase domain-containing protein n=1 Tax=Oceanospirillum beijerinckii TaxID=64976 RepID=UPI00042A5B51|nr:lytic transglycosylase domain-containing protein [Oceanospirillum beijerinckii]
MIKYLAKKILNKWVKKKAKGALQKSIQNYLKKKLWDKDYSRSAGSNPGFHDKYQKKANVDSAKKGLGLSSEGHKKSGNRRWQPPETAKPYLSNIRQAEKHHCMPENLLARLIYQESRYRKDIITGKTVSSAGAVGIAQIVPKWHPDVDPLNPEQSIHYAAKYLSQLKRQFGDWPTALAAYNWGPGNVSKAQKKHGRSWLDKAPRETQNYVGQIWGDVA